MATINKCSLDNMYRGVLAVGNTEANAFYPPFVFDQHINIATALLIPKLVASYPISFEMLEGFTAAKKIRVIDGVINLPEDYRALLGVPSVRAVPDKNSLAPETEAEMKIASLKSERKSFPLTIVPISEFDNLTISKYKAPTMTDPIGAYFGSGQIRVAPYDIGVSELRYVRQEKTYRYGYITQPDDTILFDPTTTVESEWADAAYMPLFKAILFLYGAYTRSGEAQDWAKLLSAEGIL